MLGNGVVLRRLRVVSGFTPSLIGPRSQIASDLTPGQWRRTQARESCRFSWPLAVHARERCRASARENSVGLHALESHRVSIANTSDLTPGRPFERQFMYLEQQFNLAPGQTQGRGDVVRSIPAPREAQNVGPLIEVQSRWR